MREPNDQRSGAARPGGRDGAGAQAGNGAAVPRSRAAVANQLKSLFAELTSGPMPDHLLQLVDQLDTAQEAAEDEPAPPR